MTISQEFVAFAHGLRPQPETKKRSAPRPGTIGSLSGAQFKELMQGTLIRALPGARGRPEIKFKDFAAMDRREALQALLAMTAAEREQLLAQLDRLDQAAREWGMSTADLVDFLKSS